MRKLTRSIITLAVLALAGPALAQNSFPPGWSGMLGEWSLEGEDATVYQCLITLRDDPVMGAFGVDVPGSCSAPGADVVAWRMDDGNNSVVLLDAGGKPVLTLQAMDDNSLLGTDSNDGPQFFMVQPGLGE